MKSQHKIYLLLGAIGVVSLVLALLFMTQQQKSRDLKQGVLKTSLNKISLAQAEEINFSFVKSDKTGVMYFSDKDSGFYNLNLENGSRTLSCQLKLNDFSTQNIIYADEGKIALIFGSPHLDTTKLAYLVNIKNCQVRQIDSNITSVNWSESNNKFIYTLFDDNLVKTKLMEADIQLENPKLVATLDGEIFNIYWLNKTNIAYFYYPSDDSATDIYALNLASGESGTIMRNVKNVYKVAFYKDGRVAVIGSNKTNVKVYKYDGRNLIEQQKFEANGLKDITSVDWLNGNNLIITTPDQYGNTESTWLAKLDKKTVRKLQYDTSGLQYTFMNFTELSNSRVFATSYGLPYVFLLNDNLK